MPSLWLTAAGLCMFSDCSKIASYLNCAKKGFGGLRGACRFPECPIRFLKHGRALAPIPQHGRAAPALRMDESPVPITAQAARQFPDKSCSELTNRKMRELLLSLKTRPMGIQVMPTVSSRLAGSESLSISGGSGSPEQIPKVDSSKLGESMCLQRRLSAQRKFQIEERVPGFQHRSC